jgi:hypothetical protein
LPTPGRMSPHFSPEAELASSTSLAFSAWAAGGAAQVAAAAACVGKRARCGRPARAHLPIGRGWPTLKAALRLIWRWRGALEGEVAEACGQLLSTQRVAVAAARIARRLEDVVATRNVDARGSTAGRGWTEPCTRPRQTSATAVGLRMMRGRSIPQVAAEDARM